MQNIKTKFWRILKYMGIPKEQVKMNTSFERDLDFNEFQFSCLGFYIESYFKINIFPEDYCNLDTIGNAMNFIKSRIEDA